MDFLPLFIIVPLAGAALALLAGRFCERIVAALSAFVVAILFALSCDCLLLTGGGAVVVHKMGGWGLPLGSILVLDGLSTLLLVVISSVSLMAVIFSSSYVDRFTDKPKYFALFLTLIAGLSGVVLSGDIFNLYVFMELASLSSYALIAYGCEAEELEASVRYMALGWIASLFMIFAIALIYGVTGTLNMALISSSVAPLGMIPPLKVALALLLMGFSLKAAIVPFHAWLPDAHTSAPAPVSAMLSAVVVKVAGVYALARIFFNVFGAARPLSETLMAIGALSIVFGSFMALSQWDMKRMFAYSTISQIGYIIFAFGLGTPLAILGGLFHLFNHAGMKSLLFLSSGSIDHSAGTRDLRKMGGLKEKLPATWGTSLIGSLSVAGVPPLSGFWSKLIIIFAAVSSGRYIYASVAVLMSVLTLAYFLKAQKYAFYGPLRDEFSNIKEAPLSMLIPMITLAAVCVISGILFPFVLGYIIEPAAAVLIKGVGYSLTVIGG